MSTTHCPSTSPHRQIVRPPKKSFFGTKETFLAPAGTGQSRSLGVQRSRRRAGIAPWINHHDVHVPLSPVSTPLQLRRPSRARGITVAARAPVVVGRRRLRPWREHRVRLSLGAQLLTGESPHQPAGPCLASFPVVAVPMAASSSHRVKCGPT